MIFRDIIEAKASKPFFDTLMESALSLLAFRLGTEFESNSEYSLSYENFYFRFNGYNNHSKKRPDTMQITVSWHDNDNDSVIMKSFNFYVIIDKKTEPLVTEIVNEFLRLRSSIIKAIKAFDKIKRLFLEKFPSSIITYRVNKMFVSTRAAKDYFIETLVYNDTWFFSIRSFDGLILQTENPQEIIDLIPEYKFDLLENEEVNVEKVVSVVQYLSKSLDEDIIEIEETRFRKTYNGLMRLPELYVLYKGLRIGCVKLGEIYDSNIMIMYDDPETELKRQKYACLVLDDYPDASVFALSALVKSLSERFIAEVAGLQFIVDEIKEHDSSAARINHYSHGVEINLYRDTYYIRHDLKKLNLFKLSFRGVVIFSGTPQEVLEHFLSIIPR
jgi:hypothetical protein